MKDEIKNGKNVSLDGITVINEGVSLTEKEQVKEEVTPVVEETKNEEPVITPDVQINSTPVSSVIDPVVSMPEPPVMGTLIGSMPETSPIVPSYDYPSFESNNFNQPMNNPYESYNVNPQGSSMFGDRNFDFSTEEGIKKARDVINIVQNAFFEAAEKNRKENANYKAYVNKVTEYFKFTPDNGGNTPKF